MKNLLLTFILALYEGLSLIWAYCPIRATIFFGMSEEWTELNADLIGKISYLNMIIAIVMLCLLCYSQGLEDSKHNKE